MVTRLNREFSSYWIHARPRTFALSFVFALTGYALAPAALGWNVIDLLIVFLAYSVLLFGGTCCVNTAFDGEGTGPLNFLDEPPPIPKHLTAFGSVLLFAGGLLLWWQYGAIAGAFGFSAIILSYAYNCPIPVLNRRGKETPILDNIIDSFGCGALGVAIGISPFIVTAHESGLNLFDERFFWVAFAFTVTVFGTYPVTQVFQMDENSTYEKELNHSSYFGAARALKLGVVTVAIGLLFLTPAYVGLDWATVSVWSRMAFAAFLVTIIVAMSQQWKLARSPFCEEKEQYKILPLYLLARLFWIVGELLI